MPTCFNCLPEQGARGGGVGGGVQRDTKAYLLCSQYLVPIGLAWAERGMDDLYISIAGL